MPNKKSKKKTKAAQFVIRVDRDERDAFVALCDTKDTSAAREIRKFMREWVTANRPDVSTMPNEGATGDLLPPDSTSVDAAPTEATAKTTRKTRTSAKAPAQLAPAAP